MLETLFSESNSRFILTCRPEKERELEKLLEGHVWAKIGTTMETQKLRFQKGGKTISVPMDKLLESYKKTLQGV